MDTIKVYVIVAKVKDRARESERELIRDYFIYFFL